MSFEGETQVFKIPHLRNLYQKIGMFGMPDVGVFKGGNNGDQGPQVRGFGFLHDGGVDTPFRFHNASVFDLNLTEAAQMEQFMFAFDTNLAPVVGQQITLTSTNSPTVGPRISLLINRAAQNECDVTVKGTLAGEARGWYRNADGLFQPDRGNEPAITDAALRMQAGTSGQELTYTCVPPGSGVRIGVDRDLDSCFDGDEVDGGTDPADPSSVAVACLTCLSGDRVLQPRLRVTRNLNPTGDERLTLRGDWEPLSTPSVNPLTDGFTFRVNGDSGVLFSRQIPGGAPPTPGAAGWTVNRAGTRWTFNDRDDTDGDGITKVIVINRSSPTRGTLYKFRVKGKDNNFQIPVPDLPPTLLVGFGAPAQIGAGQCANKVFNAVDGCRASSTGDSVACDG
jgi:hypothetical protein